jgi:hypothetical protein
LPPGIEIYSGCVFLIAGWWYWLEAHYRRVDRQCEALRTSATERTTKLAGIVSTTSDKWQQDVKGKEEMLLKVQRENARLAQLLDRVSLFLRRCNVPVS